jgi:hypothetical protein
MISKKHFLKKYKQINKFLQTKTNIFNHKKELRKRHQKTGLIVIAVLIVLSTALFSFDVFSQEADTMVLDMSLSADNYDSATKTFTDRSGSNNDGVSINNAVFETGRYGSVDGAMSFNGVSDYVDCGNINTLNNTTKFSIEFWGKEHLLSSDGYAWGGVYFGYRMYSNNNIYIYLKKDGGNQFARINSYGNYINADEWAHFFVVYNGDGATNPDKVQAYINGKKISLTFNEIIPSSGANDWGDNFVLGHNFDGSMSDVKIHDRALSESEIQSLYDSYEPKISAGSLNKGLVGHWSMDEVDYNSSTNRLTDKTPYSNHGTGSGLSTTSDRNENIGDATNFNGGSSSVVFEGTNSDYNFTAGEPFSYGAWFYATSFPASWHGIISKMPTWGEGYNLQVGPSNKIACGIGVYVSTSWTPEINKWYHSMCVYDGSKMTLYVDGVEENSSTYAINPGNTDLKLGMFYTYGALPFYGKIDDVRIYNRALSELEVQSLHNSYNPKISAGNLNKGLVGQWSMDEEDYNSSTNKLTDKTPYSNHGTNNGATFTTGMNGVENGAMSFDGVNNYIDLGNDSSIKPISKITVSTWVKFNSLSSNVRFLSDWHQSISKDRWLFYANSATSFVFHLGTPGGSSTPSFTPTFGVWYHVVGVYDGQKISLFIDGDLVGSTNKTGIMNETLNESVRIGKQLEAGLGFDGSMSDVRIYNRALSETEIQSLYDQGGSGANMTVYPE